jgi:bifunctional UDP-N-acetylglucosamine pyrophosphorylase/glucosamine-1-phosphate N-acetyltransferase
MSQPASRWCAVILAAGQGTRMRSRLPKVAHPLAGRPIVRHVVECARAAGVEDCVLVVGQGSDADAVRKAAGVDVRFAVQPEQLGTGHAVECAREVVGNAAYVLIMNGDVPLVLPKTLGRLMSAITSAREAPDLAILTAKVPVEAYGVLDLAGDRIARIVETKGEEEIDRSEERYINSGQYAVRADWLWSRLASVGAAANGERYLTALASVAHEEGNPAIAVAAEEPAEVRGINDRVQLAEAETTLRERIRRVHMLAGVTIVDPPSTFIDSDVHIGTDTTLAANTHLLGDTKIGEDCVIGPGTIVRSSRIGDRVEVRMSMVEESTVEDDVDMGPYSHLRPGSYVCQGAHIGNFAEVKASRLGPRAKMGHFSYIGDAEVGADVNIGAGTITANYDGEAKHRTVICDGAFIGSDTMLVAPVRVGRGSRTSAGSVVTRDVPDGMLAVGAPARLRSPGGAADPDAKDGGVTGP